VRGTQSMDRDGNVAAVVKKAFLLLLPISGSRRLATGVYGYGKKRSGIPRAGQHTTCPGLVVCTTWYGVIETLAGVITLIQMLRSGV
jgi:hypothetical protein